MPRPTWLAARSFHLVSKAFAKLIAQAQDNSRSELNRLAHRTGNSSCLGRPAKWQPAATRL